MPALKPCNVYAGGIARDFDLSSPVCFERGLTCLLQEGYSPRAPPPLCYFLCWLGCDKNNQAALPVRMGTACVC